MNIKYRIIIFPKNKRQGSVHVNDQSTIWWKHITYYLISIANFSCYALSVFKDKIDNWTMDCKKSTHVINFFCYFYYFYVVFMQKPFKLKIDVGIKLLRQTLSLHRSFHIWRIKDLSVLNYIWLYDRIDF